MFPRRAHLLLLRGPPQSDSQSQSSGSQSPLLTLFCDNLLETIRSAPKGSAQGVTGWRYKHLSYFLPRDGSVQARILHIATCLARGDAPVGFISLLAGGRCFALNKNARGTEVRPIVVGDVLRWWVTRAILLEFGIQFERHLGPLQFAVRTRAGTEKLFGIRCVQTYLQRSPSSAMLNLDASNAFNTCDRQVIMNQVYAHFPQLYSFFALWYRTPSDLVFRDQSGLLRRIICEEGVQQGDVVGPFLFCMGLKPSLDGLAMLGDLQAKHRGRGCFVGAFMDDASMVFPLCPFQQIPTDGHDDSILHAWRVDAARLQSFGLTLRPDKSSVHSPSWQGLRECPSAYPSPPGITPSLPGFRLCGAASGTTEYQSAHFDKKLREAWELSQAVEEYGDPQGAYLLFRFCVLPKLIYLTRIMGDVITLGEWSQADRELGESWARIMGMTEQEWVYGEVRNQAYLPQYQGGLGLICFRATATAGLLGSCGATLSTVIERLTDQSFFLGPSQSPDRDAFFVLPWLQASKREYERAESAMESVKLKAYHPLHRGWDTQSGCWWRAPHTQEQQKITDSLHQSRRVFFFSKVKGVFTQILRGLRHTHVLEETTFGHFGVATDSRLTEERNKRVDLFASLSNGDTLLADVSMTFFISSDASHLRTRSKTAGAAAKTKSEEKVWKYTVAARAVGLRFVLLVFETFGHPDRETVSFVKELVSVASSRAGFSTEGELMAVQARLTDRYWKILGCTLQRYVAINVLTSAFHGRGQRGPF
uniref:Reverse transcriptase domain-containing protein n=1 Tax=Chromera velia CCMP2878 TaxID=1169474 RepID=A0A0G4GRQ9_9ALVE|eukprot:Cvel_23093.t1-p1 / transcript=Cvel_23093.t1 / gene=Cvel_23093 / organism=Chromera_velia_CCMP2878 / gene_product=hypothetical protein / transcript_product=hypothetical protein / location=Cvel_scaffold2341:13837-16383(+) / protein_length=761 / sequence_SO=supercontig / SO=protein_coding / is_pseudo=false